MVVVVNASGWSSHLLVSHHLAGTTGSKVLDTANEVDQLVAQQGRENPPNSWMNGMVCQLSSKGAFRIP